MLVFFLSFFLSFFHFSFSLSFINFSFFHFFFLFCLSVCLSLIDSRFDVLLNGQTPVYILWAFARLTSSSLMIRPLSVLPLVQSLALNFFSPSSANIIPLVDEISFYFGGASRFQTCELLRSSKVACFGTVKNSEERKTTTFLFESGKFKILTHY